MKKSIIILLALTLAFSLTGCKSSDYKTAADAMAAGNYMDAMNAFNALGDYKDSVEMAGKCAFEQALKEFDAGNYEQAKKLFAVCGATGSDVHINQCDYEMAKAAFAAGKIEEARAGFSALGDFSDSAEQVKKCDYTVAMQAMEAEDYDAAEAAFAALGDYEDSAEKVEEIHSIQMLSRITGVWTTDTMFCAMDPTVSAEFTDLFPDGNAPSIPVIFSLELTDAQEFTMTLSVVEDELDTFVKEVSTAMGPYLLQEVEKSLIAQGFTMEELYEELGTDDPDAVIPMLLNGMTIEEYVEALGFRALIVEECTHSESGSFTMEGSSLILEDQEMDSYTYDADTDTITIMANGMVELLGVAKIVLSRG